VGDVPVADLAEIETGVQARTAAAIACRNLLTAARAQLRQLQQQGEPRVQSVQRIQVTSGYRSASQQFASWQTNFPMYYERTRDSRDPLAGGAHGAAAVRWLAAYIGGRLGAPGYSLHNNGLAVDLSVIENGVRLRAITTAAHIQLWRQSWLFEWLTRHAADYGYHQNTAIDEPWHWEYRGTQATATPSLLATHDESEAFLLEHPFPIADERFDFDPAESLSESQPIYTVLDGDARIRTGPPQWQVTARRIPRYTRVQIRETNGAYAYAMGVDGTDYGWTAQSNLGTFYKDLDRFATIPLVPLLPLPVRSEWSALKQAMVRTYNRLGGLMGAIAPLLTIPLPAVLAVWYVESRGASHTPNQALIRFENHLFYNRWGKDNQERYNQHFQHGGHNGIAGRRWENHQFRETPEAPFQPFHGNQTQEYRVLALATRLAGEETALQCISIGGPQILISGYRLLGYDSPRAMYDAFQHSERAQVLGFFDFCQYKLGHGRNRGALLRHLAALNWNAFTRGYNGTGKVAVYSPRLQAAYAAVSDLFPESILNPPAEASRATHSLTAAWLEETTPIAAGREELTHVSLLRSHRGTQPDLVLRWNAMSPSPRQIDVVVHLHGYSSDRERMSLSRTKEPNSGLVNPNNAADLSLGRQRPTLAILPRGHYFGGRSGNGYSFPTLIAPMGLQGLMDFCLYHWSSQLGVAQPSIGRLIITAHSGGGAALMPILQHNNPHEVHVFDALYQDASALIRWAQARIRADYIALQTPRIDLETWMRSEGGALRVFYRRETATQPYSLAVHRAIAPSLSRLSALPDPSQRLADWYRVEQTPVAHGDIPRRYGWTLLGDITSHLPGTTPPML
jgi:hypothetical protein